MPAQTKRVIENVLRKKEIKYSYTDMISQNQILAEVRKSVIVNKLKEFAGAQLVITVLYLAIIIIKFLGHMNG